MVATGFYDEAIILDRLRTMDRFSRTAFAAACAERLWPLAERYFAVAMVPAAQVASLRAVLDAVWRTVFGEIEDLAAAKVLAESMVPDEDGPWFPEIGYAQSAIAAVAYATRTWLSDEAQEAVWGARQVHEAADYAAQYGLADAGEYAADSEALLGGSTVVREAVRAVEADLEASARGDLSGVQAQSRKGADALSGLFP